MFKPTEVEQLWSNNRERYQGRLGAAPLFVVYHGPRYIVNSHTGIKVFDRNVARAHSWPGNIRLVLACSQPTPASPAAGTAEVMLPVAVGSKRFRAVSLRGSVREGGRLVT